MTPQELILRLEVLSGVVLKARINRNKVTVLRKRELGGGVWQLSIHQGFLEASAEVISGVAAWLKGKEAPHHKRAVRKFIGELDVGPRPVGELVTDGKYFDLRAVYDRVNGEYFEGQLELAITWFSPKRRRRWRQKCTTLGQYCDVRKLIRINRILDKRRVPQFFVDFVVYHEMVHHVVPAITDRAGRSRCHHKGFREMERRFKHYSKVKDWEHGWA